MLRNQNSEDNSQEGEANAAANKFIGGGEQRSATSENGYSYGIGSSAYKYLLKDSSIPNYSASGAPDAVRQAAEQATAYPVASNEKAVSDAERTTAETPHNGRFSANFKFKPTLLNIFWKIDSNRDERLSKQELHIAVRHGKFHDDEEILAGLLLTHFDYIRSNKLSSSRFFDQRGLKVEEIMSYPWATFVPPDSLPDLQDPGASNTRLRAVHRTSERSL